MPSGTGKSNLLAGVANDLNKAHQQLKGKATEYDSGGSLPDGIENGVAQLVDMKFDLYKSGELKGKPFFYAAGVVKAPKEVNGITVEGLRTSIMEPLCPTPQSKGKRKTFNDHWGWIRNEISKFLGDGEIDKLKDPANDIENILIPALLKSKPHFRFRTWQGKKTEQFPNPRVNEVWNGKVDFDPSKADNGVADEAMVDETDAGDEEVVDEVEVDETDNSELSLGERADIEEGGGEDTGAIAELSRQAADAGIDTNEYENWVLVEAALNEAAEAPADEEEAEEAEESDVPEKGQTVTYNRTKDIAASEDPDEFEDELTEIAGEAGIDPDEYPTWGELATKLSKGKGAKDTYEVTFVSPSRRTVSLKSKAGSIIKNVSFDAFE